MSQSIIRSSSPLAAAMVAALMGLSVTATAAELVHDAEFYLLKSQYADAWATEDQQIDKKLKALRDKYGVPPNIVHIMWDDTAFGDVGIPAINKVRGFETPNINRMAQEGILFTRMMTEPSCTPSRAAAMTGRHPVRNGMTRVGFPVEHKGLAAEEVTIAEVLSEAGYATAMYGKWHLGDIEESYPHNQGFDEVFFTPYNQLLSLWNPIGEGVNAVQGLIKPMLQPDPYETDGDFWPKGWVMTIEGNKGQQGREWGDTGHKSYVTIDPEAQKRTLAFIRKNSQANNPFYVAYWPNMTSFIPNPKKTTVSRSLLAEGLQGNVDRFIGQVMAELRQQGIAENTLVIVMADNGPMSHNPPPGLGMVETLFRGGKGDYWEGGVRVPGFAWWPGLIEPGQIVGDMLHLTDLYTTFARLGGGTEYIPTDRIIDGLDQTALLLNGDTHGRRDYNFIYTGDELAATVKSHVKRVWVDEAPSGLSAAYYNLYHDPREEHPMLVNLLHTQKGFDRMRSRHLLWQQQYPNRSIGQGTALTGLSNARPETQALAAPVVDSALLPFDPASLAGNSRW